MIRRSDGHAESVLNSMQTIMVVLLEESEEIEEDLLLVLLSVLGRNKKVCISASFQFALYIFHFRALLSYIDFDIVCIILIRNSRISPQLGEGLL